MHINVVTTRRFGGVGEHHYRAVQCDSITARSSFSSNPKNSHSFNPMAVGVSTQIVVYCTLPICPNHLLQHCKAEIKLNEVVSACNDKIKPYCLH